MGTEELYKVRVRQQQADKASSNDEEYLISRMGSFTVSTRPVVLC